MPTVTGDFRMRSYVYSSSTVPKKLEPIAVISGQVAGRENVIVRVHDQCFTSEVFGSRRCDCREQLHESMKMIHKEDGVVIYLQQEGRGIGVSNKVAAYALQDAGMDTVDANLHLGFKDEMREYKAVPDILSDLGVKSIRLITNNPFKIDQLAKLGVKITERVEMHIAANENNLSYLKSKRDRMRHMFPADALNMVNPLSGAASSSASPSSTTFNSDHISNSNASRRVSADEEEEEENDEEDGKGGDENEKNKKQQQQSSNASSISKVAGLEGGHISSSSNCHVDEDESENEATSSQEEGGAEEKSCDVANRENDVDHHHHNHMPAAGYTLAHGKQSVVSAIAAIRQGKTVLVVDDERRENEGDLIMAAEMATPESIGFIVRYTSGVVCVAMESDRLDALALPPMVTNNEDPKQTAYTVSVDAKLGTTTGISASDRAKTFIALANPETTPADLQRPGHCFPLRYRAGGVLVRAGHTEASVDLCKLAGLKPAGVLAEVVNDDGSIMLLPDLTKFAAAHGLVLTSVQDLIAYRRETGGGAL